jgi:uncharacterized protein
MIKALRFALFAAAIAAAAVRVPTASISQSREVVVETGVRAKMRDGVSLVADIYRPGGPGKYPVLLTRTPYNRRDPESGNYFASRGYVAIFQDTRGRFDSEGEFYPFVNEANDGHDTVEWAASLPNSNGKVGMFGGSYVGATQMLAASTVPPHLESIYPYVTASEYYEGWTYQGGALAQWFASSWTSGLAADTGRRKLVSQPKEWYTTLPVEEYPLIRVPSSADLAPYFRDWVRHETDDDYWGAVRVSDHYGRMTAKGLHAGGWHDLFLKGSIVNFMEMRKRAATPSARSGQRLVVGPWAHARTSPEGKIGDVVFGTGAVLDMNRSIVDWADWSLRGLDNAWGTGAPVRIFVMGTNVWRDEQEFPLARARSTRLYLSTTGGANTAAGDGGLVSDPPDSSRIDAYDFDPMNPVPTVGGRLCCGDGIPPGPFDQRPIEQRPDVLVYSTPPMQRDLEVTGFLRLELYAASTAVDTDFTAIVADVAPDGYSRFLTDGVVRGRYRNSTKKAEPLEPGKIYKLDLDLWATSNVFKAGHRLRLYVSSSNFPRFNRNMNTGEPTARATRSVTARQTIYHDREHPSALVLPVVP